MSRVSAAFWNPIVAKEYRSRMRTWRSPLAMMVYVVLIAGLGYAMFSSMARSNSGFAGSVPNYGLTLFKYLVVFQMVLVTIVAALALGLIGIAFSTWLRRTLAATVASYMAAFLLVFGTVAFGMIFPTKIDPKSTIPPAPPAVTYLSPIVPLVAIADNGQPLVPYLIRY